MKSALENIYPNLSYYQALRNQLMETLTDEDLLFETGGENVTLGALCRQMGETEHSYVTSFKTFKQDFSYRNEQPGLAQSVERLTAWYADLDDRLEEAVAAWSDEDIASRTIAREDFEVSPRYQLEIYKEALLIFYGKADIYLKAMGKPRSQQWAEWID